MRLYQCYLTIICLTCFCCTAQEMKKKITFPIFDSITNVKLSDKTEIKEQFGCFIEHTTVGEKKLGEILKDSSFSSKIKSDILESILLNNTYYHLHRLAGNIIQNDDTLKLNLRNKTSSNYLKLRTIITIEDKIFYSGGEFYELKHDKIEDILHIIRDPKTDNISKQYFIETLYSLTSKPETGRLIFDSINVLNLADSLKELNSQLFKIFEVYKPVYEHLNSIRTWKEMDKNYDQLQKLFKCNQPIMFFQILSQNPSTVLESKKLSKLKNDELLSIINNSKSNSFYNDYRIFYLVQFLIEQNYSIRFLETIMTEQERKDYLKKIEMQ